MHYLAQVLAQKLVANSEQVFEEDVIRYGAEVILGAILQLSIFLMVAALCGLLHEILGILVASAMLRRYSGGAHCSSYYSCTFSGLFTYLLLGFLLSYLSYQYYFYYLMVVAIICFSLVYWLAPVDNPLKRVDSVLKRQHLKNQSCLVLAILLLSSLLLYQLNYVLYAVAILMGLLWQSLTLTPGGDLYITAWDRFLQGIAKIMERRKHDVI